MNCSRMDQLYRRILRLTFNVMLATGLMAVSLIIPGSGKKRLLLLIGNPARRNKKRRDRRLSASLKVRWNHRLGRRIASESFQHDRRSSQRKYVGGSAC